MVNYQTSQYYLLNKFFYLSSLGVFQYVRDILQFTVSLDHPVEGTAFYVGHTTRPLNIVTH